MVSVRASYPDTFLIYLEHFLIKQVERKKALIWMRALLVDVLFAEKVQKTTRGERCNDSGNIDMLRLPWLIKVMILMIMKFKKKYLV